MAPMSEWVKNLVPQRNIEPSNSGLVLQPVDHRGHRHRIYVSNKISVATGHYLYHLDPLLCYISSKMLQNRSTGCFSMLHTHCDFLPDAET